MLYGILYRLKNYELIIFLQQFSAVQGDSQGKLWLPKREGTRRRWGGFSGLCTLTAETKNPTGCCCRVWYVWLSVSYSRIAAIPGNSIPSRYSSIAPPPVET